MFLCDISLKGLDPSRDPLVDTDGCFFVVILTTAFSWYVGLKVYAGILTYCGTDAKHIPDGGMDGVDYAAYNFALGGKLQWKIPYVHDNFSFIPKFFGWEFNFLSWFNLIVSLFLSLPFLSSRAFFVQ